jgi:uncharacterized protein (DUF488 family)
MINNIYTIGYSGFEINEFTAALKRFGVSCIIDVRSLPYSRFYPKYNEKNLSAVLKQNGVQYFNLKSEFGARQENAEFYTNGVMDFEKFAQSGQFKRGVRIVKDLIGENETVCLMCAEKDPIICHRAILCGRELANIGFDIFHIVIGKEGVVTENHRTFEKRLLELYFKNTPGQIDLFEEDYENSLKIAYKKQNEKIGYKPETK